VELKVETEEQAGHLSIVASVAVLLFIIHIVLYKQWSTYQGWQNQSWQMRVILIMSRAWGTIIENGQIYPSRVRGIAPAGPVAKWFP